MEVIWRSKPNNFSLVLKPWSCWLDDWSSLPLVASVSSETREFSFWRQERAYFLPSNCVHSACHSALLRLAGLTYIVNAPPCYRPALNRQKADFKPRRSQNIGRVWICVFVGSTLLCRKSKGLKIFFKVSLLWRDLIFWNFLQTHMLR